MCLPASGNVSPLRSCQSYFPHITILVTVVVQFCTGQSGNKLTGTNPFKWRTMSAPSAPLPCCLTKARLVTAVTLLYSACRAVTPFMVTASQLTFAIAIPALCVGLVALKATASTYSPLVSMENLTRKTKASPASPHPTSMFRLGGRPYPNPSSTR